MNAPPDLTIHFAETPEERGVIYRHRYRVYTEEMGLYRSQANHEEKSLHDANDATGRLMCAKFKGEVTSSLRIHLTADGPLPPAFVLVYDLNQFHGASVALQMAIVTRFVVDAQHRGGMASFNLMAACCEFLFRKDVKLVFMACAPHLINLYLAFGFQTYTRNFNDPDVGFVVPMVLKADDIAHLKAVRSPLLPWVNRLSAGRAAAAGLAPPGVQLPVESAVKSEHMQPQEYWAQVYSLLNEQSQGRNAIFAGLSHEQTDLLLSRGHLIECVSGDLIIKKGAVSSSLYIIMSGVVEVRNGTQVLAVLGSGEVLGEIGFLLESPRSADVYAASDHVRILSTDEKTLRQLIDLNPTVSAKFLLNLAKTLCVRMVGLQARPTVASSSVPSS